ncbi:hypothetical protein [Lentzea pudingi]|uniref:hypothetical protein n=1 Tax=Lentzea pudingi TaxID=1789439 RepID=UPI00166BEF15|nr:hypothetical protein [Lentzea pudingi]
MVDGLRTSAAILSDIDLPLAFAPVSTVRLGTLQCEDAQYARSHRFETWSRSTSPRQPGSQAGAGFTAGGRITDVLPFSRASVRRGRGTARRAGTGPAEFAVHWRDHVDQQYPQDAAAGSLTAPCSSRLTEGMHTKIKLLERRANLRRGQLQPATQENLSSAESAVGTAPSFITQARMEPNVYEPAPPTI